jgi:hypothetical protein
MYGIISPLSQTYTTIVTDTVTLLSDVPVAVKRWSPGTNGYTGIPVKSNDTVAEKLPLSISR